MMIESLTFQIPADLTSALSFFLYTSGVALLVSVSGRLLYAFLRD